MYTKSIRIAIEIIILLCNVMPFIWDRTVTFFKLDPHSEVLLSHIIVPTGAGIRFHRVLKVKIDGGS